MSGVVEKEEKEEEEEEGKVARGDRTNLISWQSWIANVEGMVGSAPDEWEEAGKNSESLTGLGATLGK